MKTAFLTLLGIWCFTVFAQELPFDSRGGIPIGNTNFIAHWKAPENPWPTNLWVYQVVPKGFSPDVISNLMAIGAFSAKDGRRDNTNDLFFSGSGNGLLQLRFAEGEIHYLATPRNFRATDHPQNVPQTNDLSQLVANFVPKLGIRPSEILKGTNGQIDVDCTDGDFKFSANHTNFTIIEYREAEFYRVIGGLACDREIGFGRIQFGEEGRIIQFLTSWPDLQRDHLCVSATPKEIIQWIRQGKAIQNRVNGPGEGENIWPTVKSLTIMKAQALYTGDSFFRGERIDYKGDPNAPSWVKPYANLWATVDTGMTNIDVQIVCPIIDESN